VGGTPRWPMYAILSLFTTCPTLGPNIEID